MTLDLTHWLAMIAGFIIIGLSGLKGYGRIMDWYLDRKYPERKDDAAPDDRR